MGTAYVALFNYCFARRNGGQFILRIEDTDQARSNPRSEAMILRSLQWLGLSWDEGPDIGGERGPYRQSERLALYQEHADRLIASDNAFRCFCTPAELAEMRARQAGSGRRGYDGRCLSLSTAEIDRRLAGSEPFVVRLKVPESGACRVNDLLRGEIEIEWNQVDMQILLKADGMPTYHLANVVDDHLMQISHIIRGEEWISSAPKHLLLYQYLDWEAPQLCHLPLLRNPDKSKLSKRKNPTSISYYERSGFLPEALLNYLGLMAWSMPNEEEKFTLEEMVGQFSLERISLGGPIFERAKLEWLNGRWIRENTSDEDFAQRVQQWALNQEYLGQLIPLVKPRLRKLSELGAMTGFFFSAELDISRDQILEGGLSEDDTIVALELALARFDRLPEWNKDGVEQAFRDLGEILDLKFRKLLRPFYIAITGQPVATPLFDSMAVLGRDLCRARLREARNLLGSVQEKEKKAFLKSNLKKLETGDLAEAK